MEMEWNLLLINKCISQGSCTGMPFFLINFFKEGHLRHKRVIPEILFLCLFLIPNKFLVPVVVVSYASLSVWSSEIPGQSSWEGAKIWTVLQGAEREQKHWPSGGPQGSGWETLFYTHVNLTWLDITGLLVTGNHERAPHTLACHNSALPVALMNGKSFWKTFQHLGEKGWSDAI